MKQGQLFSSFLEWISNLDKEIQWRKKVTLYDICDNDDKIIELYTQNKTSTEAAMELISEVSSSTS
jgi:hypothetical protein